MTIGFKEFSQIKKHLKNSDGISYLEFLNSLKSNYIMVWKDICLGYLALILCMALSLYALRAQLLPAGMIIFIGSFFVGYCFHYIFLFLHEAAHLNIHPSRKWNDRFTNLFITSWVGLDIKKYRILHFKHLSHLGTTFDSEITYFQPLTFVFILKFFFGTYLLEIVISYLNGEKAENLKSERNVPKHFSSQILLAVFLHLLVLIMCWQIGGVELVCIWLIGMGIFSFLLTALRQILEHRSEFALDEVNYRQIDHGEETRMFGDGLIDSTFGAAGFNRHLLHHWEPQVSYTNLKELENFLCDTPLKEEINSKRSTYLTTFYRLFRWKIKRLSPVA